MTAWRETIEDVHTDNGNISYAVLTELPAIARLMPEWNALLARSGCNLAFSSAQWFIASCLHNEEARPFVLVAARGHALIGILPLVVVNEGTVATFGASLSDYNDLVAEPDDVPALTGLLSRALPVHGGYERLILSGLRDDSNCIRAARILNSSGEIGDVYSTEETCPYIRLLSSYDEYLRTRSKSFRTSLLQAHRYAERGNVRIAELQPDSFPPECLPEVFLSLHLNRFAEDSCFASPTFQTFLRAVVPSLFIERRLRAFVLYEAESIIAINLCMVGANSLCLWNGGFIAEAERWSPGKLLISAGIREAYALNMTEYDFMRGSETYKSRWADDARHIGQLEFNRH